MSEPPLLAVRDLDAFYGDFQALFDLRQTNVGPLRGQRGVLAQSADQELLLRVDDRIVDGGSAQVHSGHYAHVLFPRVPRIADAAWALCAIDLTMTL